MVGRVGQQMECGGVHRVHVVSASNFYCGIVGCWVDVVADMGMCWSDLCSSGSGIQYHMYVDVLVGLQIFCEIKWDAS